MAPSTLTKNSPFFGKLHHGVSGVFHIEMASNGAPTYMGFCGTCFNTILQWRGGLKLSAMAPSADSSCARGKMVNQNGDTDLPRKNGTDPRCTDLKQNGTGKTVSVKHRRSPFWDTRCGIFSKTVWQKFKRRPTKAGTAKVGTKAGTGQPHPTTPSAKLQQPGR